MRNGDGVHPAKPVDQGDRGVIDQRDAIPQDIPLRCAKEQCALADGELRLRADADEAWLVLAEAVVVRNPEPFQRCPRLPPGRDVLALVFADGALSRWSVVQMNAGMVSPIRPLTRAALLRPQFPAWVNRAGLRFGHPLPVYPGQRTLSDRPGR